MSLADKVEALRLTNLLAAAREALLPKVASGHGMIVDPALALELVDGLLEIIPAMLSDAETAETLRAERDNALARVKHAEDALNNALEQLASSGAELAALKAQIDDDALQAKADASEQEYYDER